MKSQKILENKLISKTAIVEFWYGNIICDPPDFWRDFAGNPSVMVNIFENNLIAEPRSIV